MNETLEDSLEEQWQRAIEAAPTVIKGLNPDFTPEQVAEAAGIIDGAIHDLAESPILKVVAVRGEDGTERRTVEPDWAETPGFGLPVDVFAAVMGMDTPHIYSHGDIGDPALLWLLANVANKPVSALVNGEYHEAVSPEVPPQA